MTNEQREAIDRLQELVNLRKRKNNIKHDTCICGTEDLDIVLSILKEKDEEKDKETNSKNKTINALQCALKERTEERDRKDDIVTKQNKIIDLMTEFISKYHCFEVNVFDVDNECKDENNCKDCIKQYFERKVEDVKDKR